MSNARWPFLFLALFVCLAEVLGFVAGRRSVAAVRNVAGECCCSDCKCCPNCRPSIKPKAEPSRMDRISAWGGLSMRQSLTERDGMCIFVAREKDGTPLFMTYVGD